MRKSMRIWWFILLDMYCHLSLYCHELIGKIEEHEGKKIFDSWWLYAG